MTTHNISDDCQIIGSVISWMVPAVHQN